MALQGIRTERRLFDLARAGAKGEDEKLVYMKVEYGESTRHLVGPLVDKMKEGLPPNFDSKLADTVSFHIYIPDLLGTSYILLNVTQIFATVRE